MSDIPARELTLEEWVGGLPDGHRARKELAKLETELSDIKESHRIVMDERCPSDEVHCTCVPILRAENEAWKRCADAFNEATAGVTIGNMASGHEAQLGEAFRQYALLTGEDDAGV